MKIDAVKIEELIKNADPSLANVASILEKASAGEGLGLEDAATLLSVTGEEALQALYGKAGEIKERVFGKRVVLFAPLYLSNHCTNGCVYCGFRSANKTVARKALTVPEAVREARALEEMGFKRALLVTGEDPRWGVDYIVSCVRAIYENTGIRIIHLNAPPVSVDDLRKLKASGAGVYQAFQETYYRPAYEKTHPWGAKKDFDYRLDCMDRAIDAGFQDVGIGPLLGLYDYKFDCLATIAHSMHLYEKYGTHAHTISIPRLRPAEDMAFAGAPYPVSDEDFMKIAAVFRLSVPSAGLVITTREPAGLRNRLLHIGASQMSAGSRTDPGGYTGGKKDTLEQFSTTDHRGLVEVMRSVVDEGFLPSLCTTCYRVGRVGGEFTEKAVSGQMEKFCQANAILTLKEYVLDHMKNGTREAIELAVDKALAGVKDPALKKGLIEKLGELEAGKRDLFF